jgi:aryl-alcohol dehydrogenase-like predicted oxidoreductase
LFSRERVESEYAPLYEDPVGLGLTTWSPLASGLLTGKYADGSIPEGSRAALAGYGWLKDRVTDARANEMVSSLSAVAESVGCSVGQLAIAWCARNPHVSSVILGASGVEQLRENLAAIEVVERLDDDVVARIEAAVAS